MAYKDIEKKRECDRIAQQKRRARKTEEQKEQDKLYQKEYRENNVDVKRKYNKQYRENNKESISVYQKEYYTQHKDKYIKSAILRNNTIKYTQEYKERRNLYAKKYRVKHLSKIREHENYRRQTDSSFRLIKLIRNRTRYAIKHYNIKKTSNTMKMLGCDVNTLLEWLQGSGELYDQNFDIKCYDGMKFHIDHIKTFEDVSKGVYKLEEVCHYTNLQILPAEINLSKGGNSW